MKPVITILLIAFCIKSFSQEQTERIPVHVQEETMAALLKYGGRLPELRYWMSERNGSAALRTATGSTLFRWPMRVNSNYDDVPGYYQMSNYMDINRDKKNAIKADWFCNTLGADGAMTYKGHEGNDYSLYPFTWRMKASGNVFASAGAPGIVLVVRDSITNDNNCMRDTLEDNHANYVSVLHADSSISRYLHIKTGSALVKEGQFVQEGQLLAKIASSGHTSNPHLHFDLQFFRANSGEYDFVEPFKKSTDNDNTCNPFTTTSWWQAQRTYVEPRLLRVMTHSLSPSLEGYYNDEYIGGFCPEVEDAKPKTQFEAGQLVVVGVALQHVRLEDSVHIRIIYPNGIQWTASAVPVPNTTNGYTTLWRNKIYLTRNFILPSSAPTGTYNIITDYTYLPFYAGNPYQPQTAPQAQKVTQTFNSYFTVGCTPSQTVTGTWNEKGYIVGNDLNSTQTLTGKVLYQSANYIQLNPGFTAQQGCTLKARVRDCNFSD